MTVVSDAGPLIALAKIGALDTLFQFHPEILTPPAVHAEAVTAGMAVGARDAEALEAAYGRGHLKLAEPRATPLPVPAALGRGEEEGILLAMERRAEWILMDDWEARQVAVACFQHSALSTRVKGTLGILITAWRGGGLSSVQVEAFLRTIEERSDIWISTKLCRQVRALVAAS